jgi:hypothetical protein
MKDEVTNLLNPTDVMGQHPVVVEMKVSLEILPFQHSGEPVDVIGPHVVIRDLRRKHPMRDGLVGFNRFTEASFRRKDDTVESESIDELEMEFPPFSQIERGHAEFLLGLPDGSLKGSLTRFEASTGSIDFAGAEAPFLTNHQDLPLPAHKAEGGPHGRLPAFPEGGVLGIHREGINLENRKEGRIQVFLCEG